LGLLYLEVKGADGGRRYYKSDVWFIHINDHYADGGEGATLAGNFLIGVGPGRIPPGSTIRFIIGEMGGSDNSMGSSGSAGGGGTGILFKPPGGGNGEWQHLIVAGGGSGAYADPIAPRNAGRGGKASPDCTKGTGGSKRAGAAGGGGWKEDGKGEDAGESDHPGGRAGWPNGGDGGQYGTHGGWGYGGGGHSVKDASGGGGGGGACGGGGGVQGSLSGASFNPGDGGKSCINQDFVMEEKRRDNGGTVRSPEHGYAKFRIQKTKLVFVTSNKHKGDMGGIAKADTICNNRASAAGLDGTFKAWLGDGVTGPVDNFINTSSVYSLVNGQFVGTWSDLVNNTLKNPISVTEFGDTVASGVVWTGVVGGATLTWSSNTCDGWTTKIDTGAHGDVSQTDWRWSRDVEGKIYICSTSLRLYCFEQ
jgi:hypothetical protein